MADSQATPDGAKPSWYITTAIPYVNAPPHIGFAMEMIQADVLARYRRAAGWDVRLQAGTDENSLKNVQAAERAGLATEELVGTNAQAFMSLHAALNLSVDDFIRTSTDSRHRVGVEKLWSVCAANGDIYKKAYRGLYCAGCEQFYKPAELNAGLCPEHGTAPEEVAEENYFFRLSRYQDRLHGLIAGGAIEIVPISRRNEVLRWIEDGLDDFSVSRPSGRARGWGIPVPGDPDQVIYVWFDALGNYITALDYGGDGVGFSRFWRSSAGREHVIGKGITRFHAVYWPAMLLSAGLPLPTRILVHGYVTVEGQKIGKSAGNAIDPVPVARDLGADALRYFLLRHIRSTADGDFTRDRLVRVYRTDLAGQLGNLAHRTLSMVDRYCGGVIPDPGPERSEPGAMTLAAQRLPAIVDGFIEAFAFHDALAAIWAVVALANKHVAATAPWSLAARASGAPRSDDSEAARAALHGCLADLAHVLSVIGRSCAPFLPTTSEGLLRQIGVDPDAAHGDTCAPLAGNAVDASGILFPKID